MEHRHHDQPTSPRDRRPRARSRAARPVDLSGAVVALLGALILLLLLL